MPKRFLTKPLKRLLQVGVLAVIGLLVAGVGFVEYSAQPGFCDNCHNMEPYYQSWQESSHNEVPCIQCHYAPGIKAEAMGKLQAANQVVKYVTGTYGLKPWAEIEDAACLRSGCHTLRLLEGEVLYGDIRFDHTRHLGELRRGKQLRCTSCHSQIVQGEHVAVTASTCALCHFKDRPPGQPIAGCTGCHQQLPVIQAESGFIVDHPQYVEDLVSCISCHDQVTDGSGSADQARCFTCHNEPERIDEFENTTFVHRVHIADNNVECAQCHMPIEHRMVHLAPTFELDCQSCHTGAHEAQRRMYAGLGGHGTGDMPSSMFEARVSCSGCHQLTTDVPGHETVETAGEATCLACHGTRYANILPAWQREIDRKLGQVDVVVRGARRAVSGTPSRSRAVADSLVRLAEENLELVAVGQGAHNVEFADQLLRAAVEFVDEAVRAAALPYDRPQVDLGPPPSEWGCLSCHLGVERQAVPFGDGRFDHERHVAGAGLECTNCHSGVQDHGQTMVASAADCASCHHREATVATCGDCHGDGSGPIPAQPIATPGGTFSHGRHIAGGLACEACHALPDMGAGEWNAGRCQNCHHGQTDDAGEPLACATCHGGTTGAPADALPVEVGLFPHENHLAAGMQCASCHRAPSMAFEGVTCQMCHGLHHQPERQCLSCHQEGTQEKHPGFAHVACQTCHDQASGITRWTREVCTTCHTDRVEHNAPIICTNCHQIPAMGEGGP